MAAALLEHNPFKVGESQEGPSHRRRTPRRKNATFILLEPLAPQCKSESPTQTTSYKSPTMPKTKGRSICRKVCNGLPAYCTYCGKAFMQREHLQVLTALKNTTARTLRRAHI